MTIKLLLPAFVTSLAFSTLVEAASEQIKLCGVKVEAEFEFSGMCLIRNSAYTTVVYLLSAEAVMQEMPEYFFYLPNEGGGLASWNGEAFASHAHDVIGTFERTGECYVGNQFRICVAPLWE